MGTRQARLSEVQRRARQRVEHAIDECRQSRLRAGISQGQLAAALGCSRQLITAIEAGRLEDIGIVQLSRYGAAVGLDVTVRLYPAGPPLRDIGQVRLLDRFRALIGDSWTWMTEVPVGQDPRDLRAIDAILVRSPARVGIEAVTRLVDSQGQVRPILLKQEVTGLACMILLLADTRLNRAAVEAAGATLRAAFPLRARDVLAALRSGQQPPTNGLVLA
jgi:transcriptional regulator with XRE-family HTH domain